MKRAGYGNIIDVVTGSLRQWPILTPTGYAPIDKPRIMRKAGVRADA
jgi:hypothetical protein